MLSKANLTDEAARAKQAALNQQLTQMMLERRQLLSYADAHLVNLSTGNILVNPVDQTFSELQLGELYAQVVTDEPHFYLRGRQVLIQIQPSHRSDRGNFLVNLQVLYPKVFPLDESEGWDYGRYYFVLNTAIAESIYWLKAKGQIA